MLLRTDRTDASDGQFVAISGLGAVISHLQSLTGSSGRFGGEFRKCSFLAIGEPANLRLRRAFRAEAGISPVCSWGPDVSLHGRILAGTSGQSRQTHLHGGVVVALRRFSTVAQCLPASAHAADTNGIGRSGGATSDRPRCRSPRCTGDQALGAFPRTHRSSAILRDDHPRLRNVLLPS